MRKELDPIQFEIFRHRLFNILEEGRIAIKMVSGSPVVVEGGETMCSFHAPDGTTILTAAGVLLHSWGARDFIKKTIEWYKDDPGIYDGDQFFFNDPYIGGQHLADYVIVKPIFYEGKLVAWVGSIMHTAETGGIEPGGMPASSGEIFHEGIRILGLKIVEGGKFRLDVFNTIIHQVRDQNLLSLDTKAKIASNNVCAAGYLTMVKKFGYDFVTAADQKIIDDSEAMARKKLRELPNGVWRSRLYGDTSGKMERPFKIVCTMTKEDDSMTFDFTGTSPQNEGSTNCTLPATWGQLFVILSSQLFWNVPWNGGMVEPIKLIAPEGTVVNCAFPAAVGSAVHTVGTLITEVAHECVAKMLYAAGLYEDVNSSWFGAGVGPIFGGVNRMGDRFGGMILDGFAAGVGGTPERDGVDTGAVMMNPTSTVSDVEMIEMNLPFMYLGRKQAMDSGGFGKHDGGMGPEMIYMVYNPVFMALGLSGSGRKAPAGFGMFGGYPTALEETRFAHGSKIREWFKESKCPGSFQDLEKLGGKIVDAPHCFPVRPIDNFDLIASRGCSGGGYGDPLERDPKKVSEDVRLSVISLDTANKVYGVVMDPKTSECDVAETEAMRKKIRDERVKEGKRIKAPIQFNGKNKKVMLRIHENLEVVEKEDKKKVIHCMRCGYEFCEADDNYKLYALLRERDLKDIRLRSLINGEPIFVTYQEYICPECGTLLEVDNYSPELDKEEPTLWDIQINI
jgi:N-methylhydantoinase B